VQRRRTRKRPSRRTNHGDRCSTAKTWPVGIRICRANRKGSDTKQVFTLEDGGVIHVHKEVASQTTVGYLATGKRSSRIYRLRFQYKWGEQREGAKKGPHNAGLLYHLTGADGARPSVVWPYCIQCQVKDGHTGEIVALGVSVTTTIDPSHKDMPTYKGDGEPLTTPAGAKAETKIAPATPADTVQGWNTVEITVRGDGAEHIVNGKTVARLTDAKAQGAKDAMVLLDRGRIGLQAEGHEIFYRNVELCPLDAK
jgi:hypothetical protein